MPIGRWEQRKIAGACGRASTRTSVRRRDCKEERLFELIIGSGESISETGGVLVSYVDAKTDNDDSARALASAEGARGEGRSCGASSWALAERMGDGGNVGVFERGRF